MQDVLYVFILFYMQDIWNTALGILKEESLPEIYTTWFKPIEVDSENSKIGETICLRVPSIVHAKYLKSVHFEKIQKAVSQAAGRELSVEFSYKNKSEPRVTIGGGDNPKQPINIEEKALKCGLHQGLNFESFVTGRANQVARSCAEIVSNFPGIKHNPFFIYGGVGLGKTHLMHSIGRRMLENNPETKLLCISAERFIQEVVNLSAGGRLADENVRRFDQKYRTLDALLIDDVQFLCAKGGTQQRLFGIFEALLPHNKQIILTCDSYATSLQDFDERLISRFTKGLSVGIEPAEFELRAAILLEKARQKGVVLPENVAFLIATRLNTNIRELEGALNNVLMLAEYKRCPITEDLANEALKNIVSSPRMTVVNIQKVVSDHYHIKIADMLSKRKTANIAFPRQIAMYLSKELTQKSLVDIGNEFGGRDHATVLYAIRKVSKERAQNQEINHSIHLIEQKLKNWN